MGKREDSHESYRRSARSFFEQADYEHSLILLELVMNSWNPEDDLMYDESIRQRPEHFPPEKTVEFALRRNKWNEIRINDLKERKLAPLFLPHRTNPELPFDEDQFLSIDSYVSLAIKTPISFV